MRLFVALLALCLTACIASGDSESSPAGSTVPTAEMITIEVSLPVGVAGVIGEVDGRVLNDQGTVVAEFMFESAWELPIDYWEPGEQPQETGATRSVSVELPEPGDYRFELDGYSSSSSPCGTCETTYGPVDLEAEVEDGTFVEMPRSDDVIES